MPSLRQKLSTHFADNPSQKYTCPTCKQGSLVPDDASFKELEPPHSKSEHNHEDWDPDWITYRFSFSCICDNKNCGEIAYVAGSGAVEERYSEKHQVERYTNYHIQSFFPAPSLIHIPKEASKEVTSLLEKSFALYWVDVSAAANALRASLEALLDQLKIPRSKKNTKEKVVRLNLHKRLEIWSTKQSDFAELCLVLKEVGNLGSHGEDVQENHYLGVLEIYAHVLAQLYEDDAARIKKLAEKIKSEI